MEQNATAFRTMLGNADKAAALLKDISKFARETPFTLPQVVEGSKQLLAYGFTQEQIIDNMRMLGDVSSGLKVPLGDMVYLYGTLRAQGRAYTKDLNQFMNRGIPVIEELAKKFGVTTEKIYEMTEAGQIGFKDIEDVFKKMTGEGGKFNKMMAEQAKTFGGVMSNIKDGLTRAALAFFGWNEETAKFNKGSIFETLKGFSVQLQSFVETSGPMLADMGRNVATAFGAIMTFLKPVGTWIGANKELVTTFLQGVAIGIAAILALAPLIVIAFNPFILTFAAISVAVGLLYTAWQTNFWGIRDITNSVVEGVKFTLDTLNQKWNEVQAVIKIVSDWLVTYVQPIWQATSDLLKTLATDLAEHYGQKLAVIKQAFQILLDFVKDTFLPEFIKHKDLLLKIIDELTGGWISKTDGVRKAFEQVSGSIVDVINKLNDLAKMATGKSIAGIGADALIRNFLHIPGFAKGGIVPGGLGDPQLIMAHGGERVIPVGQSLSSQGGYSVYINMDGAFIGDLSIASRLGEKIGDSIIKKLQKNVRF